MARAQTNRICALERSKLCYAKQVCPFLLDLLCLKEEKIE
jgi:hypothetical protein